MSNGYADNRVFDVNELSHPEFVRINSEIDAIHSHERERHGGAITNVFPSKRWEYPWALLGAPIIPGQLYLDAGCGTSPLATYIGQRGARVVAVEAQLRWATSQGRAARAHSIPVHPVQADICRLPFPDQYFDRIYCISVLEHLSAERQLKAMAEFTRVLKAGGLCILTFDYDEHEYVNSYSYEGVENSDIIFDRDAIYSRLIAPSGMSVFGNADFSVADWSAHRQQMSAYHHRPYTSFGLALRSRPHSLTRPKLLKASTDFEIGLNVPFLGDRYANDLGPNVNYPDWGFGYRADETARVLDEIAEMGFSSVRMWLFEAGEGLQVTPSHLVSGISKDFLASFESLQILLNQRNLKAYWCLLDGNAYVYSQEPILTHILCSERHAEAFAENALATLMQHLDPRTCFAIDLINEPEACLANKWGKTGVTWNALYSLLHRCRAPIGGGKFAPLVSCGSGWEGTDSIVTGRFEGLDLDWFDFHHYGPMDTLPPKPSVVPYGKCLLGELGRDESERWHVDGILHAITDVRDKAYSGAFVWSYSQLGSQSHNPSIPAFRRELREGLDRIRARPPVPVG